MRTISAWIGSLCLAAGALPAGATAAPAVGASDSAGREAAAASGIAGDADPLTLYEAALAALEGYPAVAAARAEQAAAQAALDEAEAARRPTLSLGAEATHYQEPALVTPIHGFDFQSFPEFDRTLVRGRLEAGYALYEGGAREARIRQRQAEAGVAEASLSAVEQVTVGRVAGRYLEVLQLAESLAADRARLAALEAEAGRVELLLEVGRAAELERLRALAALAAARAAETTRTTRLDTAERELARLIGAAPADTRAGRLAPVAPPADDPPAREELLHTALAASPEVAAARRRLAAAEAALALAESGRRPRLSLSGEELLFGSSQGDFTGEWNAGVRLAVPLYTGGAAGDRIARASAARQAAAAGLRLAEIEVERQIDEVLARLAEAAARRASLAAAVASYAEVARVEKLRLAEEAGVQSDYLEALAQLQAGRADLAEARYREVGARVELARVLGNLTPEWLASSLPAAAAEAEESDAGKEPR